MEQELLSPFHFVKQQSITEIENPAEYEPDLAKLFRDNIYGLQEYLALACLLQFPFVNTRNIVRYIEQHNISVKAPSKLLKRLWEDGAIRRYKYCQTEFYGLTAASQDYMRRKMRVKENRMFVKPAERTDSLLECASLAQWHISLLSGGKVLEQKFYEQVMLETEKTFIPSYVVIRQNKYVFHVSSFAIPKTPEGVNSFVDHLLTYKATVSKIARKKNHVWMTVLSATSTDEVRRMDAILKGRKELHGSKIYYAVEPVTVRAKGIDKIFSIEEDGRLSTISIKRKNGISI